MLRLRDALALPSLRTARVVAGQEFLDRRVQWVHVVEVPDPVPWVREGQLLLTTGYAWPREERSQRELIQALARRKLAGIGLAVPQFFERFPACAVEEARQVGLPLLEIPWEVPFAQITEEVHRAILTEQYQIIERSEAIHKSLTRAALEARTLQDLARVLGELLGRQVTFEDPEGFVLGRYDGAARDARGAAENSDNPDALRETLRARGYLQALRHAHEPLRIPAIPELAAPARVACPIRLRGEMLGVVWILEGEEPLSEVDLRAAEHAALVASLQLAHQRELAVQEARLGYAFLDALLEGRVESTPQFLERARLLRFDPGGRYRVGVLLLDETIPLSEEGFFRRERLADRVRKGLKALGAPALLSVSLNRIHLLVPEGLSIEAVWKTFEEPKLRLLVGRIHSGVEGIRRSYREACSLEPYAPSPGVYLHERMLVPLVLSGDQEARDAFLDEVLGPLRRARRGQVLVETLLSWVESGFHYGQAAAMMGVHLNTLRYRLERVSSLTGWDLADPEVRFRLQLARHLLAAKHEAEPRTLYNKTVDGRPRRPLRIGRKVYRRGGDVLDGIP